MKILVVDDQEDSAEVVATTLRLSGHEAATEYEAAAAAERAKLFDLVILDLMMPGMNGFTAAERMRRNGFKGKILLVTGRNDDPHVRVSARLAGVDEVMFKPFDADELAERVGALG